MKGRTMPELVEGLEVGACSMDTDTGDWRGSGPAAGPVTSLAPVSAASTLAAGAFGGILPARAGEAVKKDRVAGKPIHSVVRAENESFQDRTGG